ncbi:MAG: AMP-binding protein, partial [Nitrospinae bacterium]|nr:AMP-binding protein [Nitrospinota bacterium]
AREWAGISPMTREDVALRPQDILPVDADISRLIVYDTSGSTGHAMVVPQHPRSMGCHLAMMEFVLSRYGVFPKFGADSVACVDIGARVKTVVFANVFSVWNQAGFVKINLSPREWTNIENARRFISEMAPAFFTGDPVGYARMLKWDIEAKPLAMVSCAMKLGTALKDELEKRYRCPVIDTYSTTETGPLAYSAPDGFGMSVLPNDVYVEALDESGFPVAQGEMGELTITGGRNPYLPLLRYRTGDYGRIVPPPMGSADTAPRIVDFEGRGVVSFRAMDGTVVGQADVGLALRKHVFAQSQFVQLADGSLEIAIRPIPGVPTDTDGIEESVLSLFGDGQKIKVVEDDSLEGKKIAPFRCELDETR